ncbi:MAG TPA: hypothetical protein VMG74_07820 [Gaiellaceae bacterium]|nr:hypothetical protein [Gaiellaceae bacterium]
MQIDPQVAYITTAWWLEYATAAKLYNYPDERGPAGSILRPEVASGVTVSNGGGPTRSRSARASASATAHR